MKLCITFSRGTARAIPALIQILAIIAAGNKSAAGQTQPVTPLACLDVRYPVTQLSRNPVTLNATGSKVAYILRTATLSSNTMTHQLFVSTVSAGVAPQEQSSAVDILDADSVSFPTWLNDGKTIVALAQYHDHSSIELIDTDTKARHTILQSNHKITEFSITPNGRTMAYVVQEYKSGSVGPTIHTADEMQKGYSVQEVSRGTSSESTERLFLASINSSDDATTTAVSIKDPVSGARREMFAFIGVLSISPDGRYLFFTTDSDTVPTGWASNPLIKAILAGGGGLELPLLLDRTSGQARVAFNMTWTGGTPVWAPNSKQFALANSSPVGTKWEQQDIRDQRMSAADAHVFAVSAEDGAIQLVSSKVAYHNDAPLKWTPEDHIYLQTDVKQISEFRRQEIGWTEAASYTIPVKDFYSDSPMSSDGSMIVGFSQSVDRPPDLFLYRFGAKQVTVLTHLNPHLDNLSFGRVKKISWQTDYGTTIEGYLVYPPDYQEGKRYPLVINTKGEPGSFLCDYGVAQYPSFAPQPLASAGIMVLARYYPDNFNFTEEAKHFPTKYPGGLAEAFYYQNQWETAIRKLDHDGLIDTKKLGIIGFSRTGWLVEFMLVHSSQHFAAATATDNIQYSYGEYWLQPESSIRTALDTMYGGPPSGATLKNWLDYSISFNLDKIKTPLLMEDFGDGEQDNILGSVPISLAEMYEVFRGLKALHRPVDLYYYPNDVHQISLPVGRLSNLERNVDWYRFWLQGYERPNPEDPSQYKRWEYLRELRNADHKANAQSTINTAKPN